MIAQTGSKLYIITVNTSLARLSASIYKMMVMYLRNVHFVLIVKQYSEKIYIIPNRLNVFYWLPKIIGNPFLPDPTTITLELAD